MKIHEDFYIFDINKRIDVGLFNLEVYVANILTKSPGSVR